VLSLERQAADALRAGKRDQAAVLYDQLAAQHPENPAYKEAARIIRASK
jgi:predicted Zn-dependent protease